MTEVDSAAKYGFDLPIGCFELCDQIGVDIKIDVLEYMHETLGEGYAPCSVLERKVNEEQFGKKTKQGFCGWENSGADVPSDMGREKLESRLVAVAINEAAKPVGNEVTDSDVIDEGFRLGAGLPDGPTRMAAGFGYTRLRDVLIALHDEAGAARYTPADYLEMWQLRTDQSRTTGARRSIKAERHASAKAAIPGANVRARVARSESNQRSQCW